jgi:hypothetical protein
MTTGQRPARGPAVELPLAAPAERGEHWWPVVLAALVIARAVNVL